MFILEWTFGDRLFSQLRKIRTSWIQNLFQHRALNRPNLGSADKQVT